MSQISGNASLAVTNYRAPGKSMIFLLSRTKAGPGRTVKPCQAEQLSKSRNTFLPTTYKPLFRVLRTFGSMSNILCQRNGIAVCETGPRGSHCSQPSSAANGAAPHNSASSPQPTSEVINMEAIDWQRSTFSAVNFKTLLPIMCYCLSHDNPMFSCINETMF